MRVLLIDFNPFMAAATPISIGYVGAALKCKRHNVQVLSLGSATLFSPLAFKEFIREYAPDIVGFGTYQRSIFHINALATLVKEASPEAFIILGGPHITFLPDDALSVLTGVDFLCRGEGEPVILAVTDAIQSGKAALPVPGTTSRNSEGGYITGPSITPAKDLDEYPSPWLEGILDPADMDEAIMLTSRGCPHVCSFCYTPAAFGRKVRAHSVDRVIQEIAFVASRGSGRLWFADPNFSFSEKRVIEILEEIVRRDLKLDMWIETRADMLNKELIALMKRAGVNMIAMGLESASENVYPHLNKNLDPDRIREAIEMAFAAGLDVELFSQYALPHERFVDAMQTLNFVKESGVKIKGNSNAQQMQIYYGSEIAADPAKFGVKPLRDSFQPCMAIGTEFETEWMTRREIEKIKAAWKIESLDGGKRVVS
ncbi:MAG: cobalamin B12-binding domain-containing protein [Chloroflexi bacterium]|nr:cobalamin B12-binding domain-containing protein [Chloroflexota bacterium]